MSTAQQQDSKTLTLPKDGEPLQEEMEQEQEQKQEPQQVAPVNPEEVQARQTGWVSKQEWIDQGKDPDDWVNAKRYNQTGQMVNTIKGLQKQVAGFDQRIADNNALWKAQLEAQREALMSERDDAIDVADRSKVKALDKQIQAIDQQTAKLATQQPPPQNQQQLSDADVQAENLYWNNLTAEQQDSAKIVIPFYVAQGLKGQALVNAVKAEVDRKHPVVNAARNTASKTDSGRPGSKRTATKAGDLTLDSLTSEDRLVMDQMRRSSSKYANKSDAEMLSVLKDSKL